MSRVRRAVHQRDSIKQERRGKGTQQKIFDCGLIGLQVGAPESRQHISRNGGDFQPDENHDQLVRPAHEAHPHGGEEQQAIVFAVIYAFAHQVLTGREDRKPRDDQEQEVEEDAEGIDNDHAIVIFPFRGKEQDIARQGGEDADEGEGREPRLMGLCRKRIEEHHGNPEQGQDQFGEDRQYGNLRQCHGQIFFSLSRPTDSLAFRAPARADCREKTLGGIGIHNRPYFLTIITRGAFRSLETLASIFRRKNWG